MRKAVREALAAAVTTARQAAPKARPRRQLDVPLWLPLVCLFLVALGIADATYLTIAHFDQHVALVCSDKGAINCAAVTTSPESHFLGMPVAVLGLAYFVFIPVLLVPAAWRSAWVPLRVARVVASGGGVIFVLYLIYSELIKIHKICLYCTGVHIITFLLFCLVAFGTALTAPLGPSYDDDDEDSALAA